MNNLENEIMRLYRRINEVRETNYRLSLISILCFILIFTNSFTTFTRNNDHQFNIKQLSNTQITFRVDTVGEPTPFILPDNLDNDILPEVNYVQEETIDFLAEPPRIEFISNTVEESTETTTEEVKILSTKSNHAEEVIDKNGLLPIEKQNLLIFDEITVDEMNDYIEQSAPANSPFINQGGVFINISRDLGVNPLYIYGHASLESGYGRSNMAISKGNYFGIGAFNSSPQSAFNFHDENTTSAGEKMINGLYQGTKWIKENYLLQGQNSLYKMIYGPKSYAVKNSGPNGDWIWKISSIIKKSIGI